MLNKCEFIGFLGKDPEVRTTPNGATVANFTLACTEKWTDQSGQKQLRTEWVNIVAWKKDAEIAQRFLRKGAKCYVEGKLETRSWDDKQTGAKRYTTEIKCTRLLLLDARQQDGQGAPARAPRQQEEPSDYPPQGGVGDDGLPF
jgi:single-strand DNA-binding protein